VKASARSRRASSSTGSPRGPSSGDRKVRVEPPAPLEDEEPLPVAAPSPPFRRRPAGESPSGWRSGSSSSSGSRAESEDDEIRAAPLRTIGSASSRTSHGALGRGPRDPASSDSAERRDAVLGLVVEDEDAGPAITASCRAPLDERAAAAAISSDSSSTRRAASRRGRGRGRQELLEPAHRRARVSRSGSSVAKRPRSSASHSRKTVGRRRAAPPDRRVSRKVGPERRRSASTSASRFAGAESGRTSRVVLQTEGGGPPPPSRSIPDTIGPRALSLSPR